MRALVRLARQHPTVALVLASTWVATWIVVFAFWTTGIELWMVVLRYAFLLLLATSVAVAAVSLGTPASTRLPMTAALAVSGVDAIALFVPELVQGLTEGGPWWGYLTAGIFFVVIAAVWIGIGGASSGLLGPRIAAAFGGRSRVPR